MNNQRIERAIEILRKVPPHKFDLCTWVHFTKTEMRKMREGKLQPRINGCGSVGCAMGWIASDKRCIADGLVIEVNEYEAIPIFENHDGFSAADAYFDFHRANTSTYLFDSGCYEGRERKKTAPVIARLETLLAAGEELFGEMCVKAGVNEFVF